MSTFLLAEIHDDIHLLDVILPETMNPCASPREAGQAAVSP